MGGEKSAMQNAASVVGVRWYILIQATKVNQSVNSSRVTSQVGKIRRCPESREWLEVEGCQRSGQSRSKKPSRGITSTKLKFVTSHGNKTNQQLRRCCNAHRTKQLKFSNGVKLSYAETNKSTVCSQNIWWQMSTNHKSNHRSM